MVKKWLKIAKKENNKDEILSVIEKILRGDLRGLNVIKMAGGEGLFRCRIGRLRIIFEQKEKTYVIKSLGYRGDIYK